MNPPDYRFCGACGQPLGTVLPDESEEMPDVRRAAEPAAVPVAPAEARPDDPRAGVRPQPLRLDGERRVATVILADVCGSTDLMEQIGTEAWVGMMNQVFHILESEIYRYGGIVDQFRGDGLVAFFGTTVVHEDDPERAVLAALAMQDSVARYADRLRAEQGIDLSLRVGVNTGEVIVAQIGDRSQHSEDTAMGEAIALAARMETAAEPGTVLVSENTFHLLASQFEWTSLGEISVKGISRPVAVYRPHGVIRERLRSLRLETYGLSQVFVGREQEYGAVKACVGELRRGRGSILSLVADEGMGKSYLMSQARQQVLRDDAILSKSPIPGLAPSILWLRAHCRSYEQSRPYSMWLDLLTRWLGGQNLSAEESLERLRGEAGALWGEDADRYCPFLARMLSLPVSDSECDVGAGLDAEALRAKSFDVIERWILALTEQSPVVLVFDDLYWADATSVDLLERCFALCDRVPVLFVIMLRTTQSASRQEFYNRLQSEYSHRLVALTLDPLSDAQSRELIDGLIGPDVLPARVCEQIVEKSGGNPYYIEELVRSLIRNELLMRDDDTAEWHAAGAIEVVDLPDSLRGLLAARLDALGAQERLVLQMASVVGMVFWENAVQAAAGPDTDLEQALVALQRARLIHDRGRVPGLGIEYVFHSSLIWELASDSVLSSRRASYCLQVADHMASLFGQEVLTQYYDVVAYLYRCAGEHRRELFYMLSAAEHAQGIYANVEALEYYGRALELLDLIGNRDSRGRTDAWLDWRIESLRGLGTVSFGMGRLEEAERYLREAIALAREGGLSRDETVRLTYWLCEVLFWQERYEEQIELAQEGRALLEEGAQTVEMALMNQEIAVAHLALGHFDKFAQFTRQTAAFLAQLPYAQELRPAYSHVSMYVQFALRDLDEAVRWVRLLGDQASAHGDVRALGQSHQYSGYAYQSSGDLDRALTEYAKALANFEQIGDVTHIPEVLSLLAGISLLQGKLDQATQYVEHSIDAAQVSPGSGLAAKAYWQLGRVLGGAGDWSGALRALEMAQQLQREVVNSEVSAVIWFDTGRVYLLLDNRAQAIECFERALEEAIEWRARLDSQDFAFALAHVEEATADPDRFRAMCHDLRSGADTHLSFQCFLEPSPARQFGQEMYSTTFGDALDPGWSWVDPMEDSVLRVQQGAHVQAANGRDLWSLNVSAPRLVRQVTGGFAAETTCSRTPDGQVAIGGLLLWQDARNYLRLDYGYAGLKSVLFLGCLEGRDVIVGRGNLPSSGASVSLCLERAGNRARAFCTLDGEFWWSVGEIDVQMADRLSIGVYAVGNIDRLTYPGAHPEGSAIRFERFRLWELSET